MPLFPRPTEEVLIDHDRPTPVRCNCSEGCKQLRINTSSDSTDSGDEGDDVFEGETFTELMENTIECSFSMLDDLHGAKRMYEGVWDNENAKKYFIARKIDESIVNYRALLQNLQDCRMSILGNKTMTELKKEYEPRSVMNYDMYQEEPNSENIDDTHMTHVDMFSVTGEI